MSQRARAGRRLFLASLSALPLALAPRRVMAAEYASASDVRTAIDTLSTAADARLTALARTLPAAADFVDSVRTDLARHRAERQGLFERLNVAAAPATSAPDASIDEPLALPRLRTALEELMHAHAEGLPALGSRELVQRLAEHMVDLSRHVTVVDLWIQQESGGD